MHKNDKSALYNFEVISLSLFVILFCIGCLFRTITISSHGPEKGYGDELFHAVLSGV